MNFLIKSAKIVDKRSAHHRAVVDVLIQDGTISQIGKDLPVENARVVSGENLHLSPGWTDMRVALNDPGLEHRETLKQLSFSASAGGFVRVLGMPNTKPTIQTKEALTFVKAQNRYFNTEILPCGAITVNTDGKDFTEMQDLWHHGAAAFTDGHQPLHNADLFLKTLQYLSPLGALLIERPEDHHLAMFGQMHEGLVSTMLGLKGIPGIAEELQIKRDLDLLRYAYAGNTYPSHSVLHFSCISTAKSVDIIRQAKKEGLPISADVTAHHLLLIDEDVAAFDTHKKVSPPLRRDHDRQALRAGLIDGTLDAVVSDHRAFDLDAKNVEFDHAEFGTVGVETCFSAAYAALPEHLETLVEALSLRPNQILGLDTPIIAEGQSAVLTLFDPIAQRVITEKSLKSPAKNSAFLGKKLSGNVLGIFNETKFELFV